MKNLKEFTNLYSLSKTLRFEIKPVDGNGEPITDIKSYLKNILDKDNKVKDAYQALKPILDDIHEKIINDSLNSAIAKEMDFSEYFEEYKKGKEKKLDQFEKDLRTKIGDSFAETIEKFNKNLNKQSKKGKEKPLFEIKNGVLLFFVWNP